MIESLVDARVVVTGGIMVPGWKYWIIGNIGNIENIGILTMLEILKRLAPHLPLLAEGEFQSILVPPLAEKTCVQLLPKSTNKILRRVIHSSCYYFKTG